MHQCNGKNGARLRTRGTFLLFFLLYPFGALAQLGERLICIQEVNGSIPLGSTKY